jgi:putative PIN family toxin of toxin-antitoxin system
MKPSIVLDTNILLDLFYFADPSVQNLYQALIDQRFEVYILDEIWDEMEEVLTRKPFLQNSDQISKLKAKFGHLFVWKALDTRRCGVKCSDPDDQLFLELSYQVAPSLLVTKDTDLLKLSKKLLPLQVQILRRIPDELLLQ